VVVQVVAGPVILAMVVVVVQVVLSLPIPM
jgi:hypothetical protein